MINPHRTKIAYFHACLNLFSTPHQLRAFAFEFQRHGYQLVADASVYAHIATGESALKNVVAAEVFSQTQKVDLALSTRMKNVPKDTHFPIIDVLVVGRWDPMSPSLVRSACRGKRAVITTSQHGQEFMKALISPHGIHGYVKWLRVMAAMSFGLPEQVMYLEKLNPQAPPVVRKPASPPTVPV